MKKLFTLSLALIITLSAVLCFSSCADKNGVKVGFQSGTTAQSFMAGDEEWGFKGFSNIQPMPYDNAALAVADMKSKNIDFVVVDAEVGKALANANKNDIKCIDIALTTESYGVAVDKNQPELLESINKILKDKKSDIDAIFKKYQNVDGDNFANWNGTTLEANKYDKDKDQLVLATNAEFAPFEFVVGNKFAGIDMEIGKLIADTLGKELVILNMDFDAITASLGKNGVDIGIAGLTINAARKKAVSFTDSYCDNAYQVILVNKDDTTFDGCKTTEDAINVLNGLGK